MTELKPCPFCGGKAKVIELDPFNRYRGRFHTWGVRCVKCGVEMVSGVSKEDVIKTWNWRADNG